MSSARWSTFTLLGLVGLAALSAFHAGRIFEKHRASIQRRATSPASTPTAQNAPAANPSAADVADPRDSLQPIEWDRRWSDQSSQPATPDGERSLAALIEELADRDPQRAISLATQPANLRLRAALLRAAMKGWGRAHAAAAVEWAEAQGVMDRSQAIAATLQGAVENPESAVQVTTALMQRNPHCALEYGNDLISALTEAGRFEQAATFAASGAAECREGWLLTAFSRWAEFQPETAAAAAARLADTNSKSTAMNSVVVGWAPTNPQALIEFSQRNLSPEQQGAALSNAIAFWAESDVAAAANWINQHAPGPVADSGVATIALSPKLTGNPQLALDWAQNISNPQLRADTLLTVVERWAAVDFLRAENYVAFSPALAGEERSFISQRLKNQSAR